MDLVRNPEGTAVGIHQRGKTNSIKDLLVKIARREHLELSDGFWRDSRRRRRPPTGRREPGDEDELAERRGIL
jgi:hypothetical protein